LFRFYIRDLIDTVSKTNIGCVLAGRSIKYADDMDPAGSFTVCFTEFIRHYKKTVCMAFKPCKGQNIVYNSFPAITLVGCKFLFSN
jgi:hypothetical protein